MWLHLGEKKMKKILSIVMVTLIVLSTFLILALHVKAQEIVWNTNPTPLPVPLIEHASVVYNGKIYVLGGSSIDGNRRNTVYFADILPDRTVGTWMTTTPLPQAREDFEAVVWNGFVYVMGGSTTGGAYLDTVLHAQIQSDGTLADWMATTSLPTAVAGYASALWNGRIYVIIGGWPGWKGEVYYAEINPDSSLGDWNPTTSLPAPRRAPVAAVRNDIIYVIGGQYPSTVYHSTVYYATVNSDGSIGAWSATESLPTKIQNARAVLVDEDIYVIGGDDGFTRLDTVFRPSINPDGTIESWTPVQDSLPEPITGHVCVVSEGIIYVLGGTGTDGYKDTIYYSSPLAPVEPDFEISVFPDHRIVTRGQSVSYTVILESLSGFSSAVSLSVEMLPSDTSFTFDPLSVVPDGTSTMTLATSSTTPFGNYTLNILGTSGGTTKSVTALLSIEVVFHPPYSYGAHGGEQDSFGLSSARYDSDVDTLEGRGATKIRVRASGARLVGGAKASAFFEIAVDGVAGSSGTYSIGSSFIIDGFMQALKFEIPTPWTPGYTIGQAVLRASMTIYDRTEGSEVQKEELDIFNEILGVPTPFPAPIWGRTEHYNKEGRYMETSAYFEEGHEYRFSFMVEVEGSIGASLFSWGQIRGDIDTELRLILISPLPTT